MRYIREKRHGFEVENIEPKVVTEFSSLNDLEGLAFKDEYQEKIVESVNNVIDKCPNLIVALESIGAMYCIPSGHIMRDDDLGTIKVVGCNAIAPGNVSASGNKQAIIRAIGAMLDNKGKDIDHALTQHHAHHAHELFKQAPQFTPNPAKGKVVGRYLDDEDHEILVYDTGMIDCVTCPSTMKKLAELRAQNLIPTGNEVGVLQGGCEDCENKQSSYFADMDDISKDVDMSGDVKTAEPTEMTSQPTNDNFGSTDISSSINESAVLVEASDVFENTHNLGHELLTLQGFDFVKPTIFKELADETESNEDKPNTKDEPIIDKKDEETIAGGGINPREFEFMRFDNKHIISAVKLINDWVEKRGAAGIGDIPFDDLYKSDEFSFAVDELSEQFDARIRVHYRPSLGENNVYTTCDETQASQLRKLKISKSKGFQFSGNPINIYIIGKHSIRDFSLGKVEFTGQTIVSILLHEIFHNAMWVWKINDTEFSASFAITLQLAQQTKSARKRRKIITNYVNMLDKYYGCDLNTVKRKILVKRLTALTAMGEPSKMKKLKDKLTKTLGEHKRDNKEAIPDQDVIDTINMYEKYMKKYEKHLKKKTCILNMILGTAGIVGSVFLFKAGESKNGKGSGFGLELAGALTGLTGTALLVSGITATLERSLIKEARKNYESSRDLEEQWCDMFAAMYKLPVTFKISTANGKRTYTDDQVSKDIIEKFNKIDIDIHKLILDCHPSGTERNYQAVKISKALLEEKDLLNPEIQKYLEWISEAYKHTGDNEDIENIYNKSVFDPKAADSLDEHLAHLIEVTDAPLTEYTSYDVLDWGIYMGD